MLTAPRPGDQGGLYQLAPVLAHGTVLGGREKVTQIEKDVSSQATVAGINGDLFSAGDGHPAGVFMSGGVLAHPPYGSRSSIGVDSAGGLQVDQVKFFGTWQGTGQRRALNGLNQVAAQGQVVLLTPAFGPKAPAIQGSAEIVLQSFPATAPNVDLSAVVTAVGVNGGEPIPPGGAIIQAAGSLAAKLQAEAPVGTQIAARLILQPTWGTVVAALGGGPLLVRNSVPVFRSLEDFTNDQIAARSPRAGVGQLADGRIILVAVDGDQPGYSVGLTSFELAQTMAGLGAVTAAAVESGPDVTLAFDGQLLEQAERCRRRASRQGGAARAVLRCLRAAPAPCAPDRRGRQDPGTAVVQDRPAVTGHRAADRPRRHAARARGRQSSTFPGRTPFTYSTFDVEGTWHWNVTATDDLKRVSTIDRAFRYDTTLRGLSVPRPARGTAAIRFTLSRPASVRLRIETPNGVRRSRPAAREPVARSAVRRLGRTPAARHPCVRRQRMSRTSSSRARSGRRSSPFRSPSDAPS